MSVFFLIVGGALFVIGLYRLKLWLTMEALRIVGEASTYRSKFNRKRPLIGLPDQAEDVSESDPSV